MQKPLRDMPIICPLTVFHGDMMLIAKSIGDGSYELAIVDTVSGATGKHEFPTEVAMCKFVGEYLINTDEPTEEFQRLFPMHC